MHSLWRTLLSAHASLWMVGHAGEGRYSYCSLLCASTALRCSDLSFFGIPDSLRKWWHTIQYTYVLYSTLASPSWLSCTHLHSRTVSRQIRWGDSLSSYPGAHWMIGNHSRRRRRWCLLVWFGREDLLALALHNPKARIFYWNRVNNLPLSVRKDFGLWILPFRWSCWCCFGESSSEGAWIRYFDYLLGYFTMLDCWSIDCWGFVAGHYNDLPPIISDALPDYVVTCRIPSVKSQKLKTSKKRFTWKDDNLYLLKTYWSTKTLPL